VKAPTPVIVPLSGFEIRTFVFPAAPAGVTAVMDVVELTTTPVALTSPNFTVAPTAKSVPVIVTVSPPGVKPVDGDIEVKVGDEAFEVEIITFVIGRKVAISKTAKVRESLGEVWIIYSSSVASMMF
jgi:hypothetical protein